MSNAPTRAGNGRFVGRDNPLAVIGRLNAQIAEARAEATRRAEAARRARVRGPLTRNEQAQTVSA